MRERLEAWKMGFQDGFSDPRGDVPDMMWDERPEGPMRNDAYDRGVEAGQTLAKKLQEITKFLP